MRSRSIRFISLLALAAVTALTFHASAAQQTKVSKRRFIVVARSAADAAALRADVVSAGGTVIRDFTAQTGALVVSGPDTMRARIQKSQFAESVAVDGVRRLISPSHAAEMFNHDSSPHAPHGGGPGGHHAPLGDPANGLPGLMWNLDRIDAPQAWKTTFGSPAVTVGVADTGLDFTHSELANRVVDVVDFTQTEDPPICKTFFTPSMSDADWAATFGGPENTDWNGHGSWIGGNIAAELDHAGINGIAPRVKLVALKISQWCGAAYDSEIIDAFLYAADHHIDIVNISFGGYLDRSDPDQDAIYNQYVQTVRYARNRGTVIVAAAGNEHVRVGAGGLVLSHGSLTIPGDPVADYFGMYETPGGIPGVVNVSSVGNIVSLPSIACAPGTAGTPSDTSATCKPISDPHQARGIGLENQLSYFSNYGPRIDVAAPGGARKFNVPAYDRGGTPGFPYTDADGTTAFEAFSITSNWALEIPCFVFDGGGFPANQCYSAIQGTSMATPHAVGTLALIASANGRLRHRPDALVHELIEGTVRAHNRTQPLSAVDLTPGDLTLVPCATGYCHLGGLAISDDEAYGAGVINAKRSVDDDD